MMVMFVVVVVVVMDVEVEVDVEEKGNTQAGQHPSAYVEILRQHLLETHTSFTGIRQCAHLLESHSFVASEAQRKVLQKNNAGGGKSHCSQRRCSTSKRRARGAEERRHRPISALGIARFVTVCLPVDRGQVGGRKHLLKVLQKHTVGRWQEAPWS